MLSSSFLVERRSSLMSISEISFHRIKSATKCEKFPNENREIKRIYINESLVDIDCLRWSSIPHEIKPWQLMGKLHECKSTVVDEKSGNSALFFQCLSFQNYHVIHQQELNTLKHLREHTVKNTAKLRRTMIFFLLWIFKI